MSRLDRNINLAAVFGPFIVLAAVIPLAWHIGPPQLERHRDLRRDVRGRRAGHHGRLPPAAHAPCVPDAEVARVRVRHHRQPRRAGPRHRLGRRPPQAPRAHRRGGRPAFARTPARAPGRAARCAACTTRTSAGCSASRAARAPASTRAISSRTRGMRRIHRSFQWLVLATFAIPFALGFALTGTLHGALTALLWGGLVRVFVLHHVDLVDQQRLPLLRDPALRHRRPLDERLLAGAAVVRRVLAPQPPRVPALGVPRPAPVGDRHLGRSSSAACSRLGLACNVVEITPERQAQLQRSSSAHAQAA